MNLIVILKHFTSVKQYDGEMWIRIGVHSPKYIDSNAPATYVVYCPRSNYLFLSGPVSERQFILYSLQITLNCHELKHCQLSNKGLRGLKDMLFNLKCQGPYKKYQKNQVDNNPLNISFVMPIEKELQEEKQQEQVQQFKNPTRVEDQHIVEQRKLHINRIFGSQTQQQPQIDTLDLVNYKDDTSKQQFSLTMTVKFRGENIMEGIRGCINQGIATPPLPSHLEELHNHGKNVFVFDTKK